MRKRLWVLGAPDPEMEAIEQLLADEGETFAYALDADGARVHPGNAYRTVNVSSSAGPDDDPEGWIVYFVECDLPGCDPSPNIDHHRPGDHGYGRPPEEFLPASSIGQVWEILHGFPVFRGGRWTDGTYTDSHQGPGDFDRVPGEEDLCEIPREIILVAAADHCLGAAYRGECPGVDPDELMTWRAESRAAFQGRSVDAVLADVEAAREEIRMAAGYREQRYVDACELAESCGDEYHGPLAGMLADLRGKHVPELPEAACREGIPYIATITDRDGREKVVMGAASDVLVREFLSGRIVDGLTGMYGDPARGFAGGYITPHPAGRRLGYPSVDQKSLKHQ